MIPVEDVGLLLVVGTKIVARFEVIPARQLHDYVVIHKFSYLPSTCTVMSLELE